MRGTKRKALRTGLLLAAGALFLFAAAPVKAGFGQPGGGDTTGQLLSRINQLENQLQTLSRAIYKGAPLPAPSVSSPVPGGDDFSGGAAASYEGRISQLENSLRQLTGQVEQLSYDIQQIKGRVGSSGIGRAAPHEDSASSSYADAFSAPRRGGSYNRTPPGEDDYRGPRGKVLGTVPASSSQDSAGALYDEAFNDIREAKYETAAVKFKRFMDNYPRHALAPNAQYWLAETYYVRQDYRNGARLFAQNYQDFPQSSKASASLLKLGLSLARLGKKEDACLSFKQLKKEFPGERTPEIQRAEREMGQLGCKG